MIECASGNNWSVDAIKEASVDDQNKTMQTNKPETTKHSSALWNILKQEVAVTKAVITKKTTNNDSSSSLDYICGSHSNPTLTTAGNSTQQEAHPNQSWRQDEAGKSKFGALLKKVLSVPSLDVINATNASKSSKLKRNVDHQGVAAGGDCSQATIETVVADVRNCRLLFSKALSLSNLSGRDRMPLEDLPGASTCEGGGKDAEVNTNRYDASNEQTTEELLASLADTSDLTTDVTEVPKGVVKLRQEPLPLSPKRDFRSRRCQQRKYTRKLFASSANDSMAKLEMVLSGHNSLPGNLAMDMPGNRSRNASRERLPKSRRNRREQPKELQSLGPNKRSLKTEVASCEHALCKSTTSNSRSRREKCDDEALSRTFDSDIQHSNKETKNKTARHTPRKLERETKDSSSRKSLKNCRAQLTQVISVPSLKESLLCDEKRGWETGHKSLPEDMWKEETAFVSQAESSSAAGRKLAPTSGENTTEAMSISNIPSGTIKLRQNKRRDADMKQSTHSDPGLMPRKTTAPVYTSKNKRSSANAHKSSSDSFVRSDKFIHIEWDMKIDEDHCRKQSMDEDSTLCSDLSSMCGPKSTKENPENDEWVSAFTKNSQTSTTREDDMQRRFNDSCQSSLSDWSFACDEGKVCKAYGEESRAAFVAHPDSIRILEDERDELLKKFNEKQSRQHSADAGPFVVSAQNDMRGEFRRWDSSPCLSKKDVVPLTPSSSRRPTFSPGVGADAAKWECSPNSLAQDADPRHLTLLSKIPVQPN